MEEIKAQWDRAAPDYQRTFRLGINDYNRGLLRFWEENGMLRPGDRVLDIGCGVGKYGTYLAELGYDVTLTDISVEMLRHAKDNMSQYSTSWTVYRCDFNEVTGGEPVFSRGFDLSISTMSPAIHDSGTVRTMSRMTRRWCFLSRFYSWEQPFRDRLLSDLGIEPHSPFDDLKKDSVDLIQAVCQAGFVPHSRYVDYCWSDARTPEEMTEYMFRNYAQQLPDDPERREKVLNCCRRLADPDGTVRDSVNTKVAWIYWNTEESFHDT